VTSTCISRPRAKEWSGGFSAIELLIGLSLTVCLALTVCPLWTHIERAAAARTDMSVALVQSRVAVARLESDMRLSSAANCRFAAPGPILEASSSQVVFLEPAGAGMDPVLVEWEFSGGALMRRRGVCPVLRPVGFGHSLYLDHKTMLERLAPGGTFSYLVNGTTVAGPLPVSALAGVEAVILDARLRAVGGPGWIDVSTVAWVGR
jgi:hypothetical protein